MGNNNVLTGERCKVLSIHPAVSTCLDLSSKLNIPKSDGDFVFFPGKMKQTRPFWE